MFLLCSTNLSVHTKIPLVFSKPDAASSAKNPPVSVTHTDILLFCRLFASIATAHALFARLAGAAVLTGLYLDRIQGAVLLIAAMKCAAGHAAANVRIRLFLRHGDDLLKNRFADFSVSILSATSAVHPRFTNFQF